MTDAPLACADAAALVTIMAWALLAALAAVCLTLALCRAALNRKAATDPMLRIMDDLPPRQRGVRS